MVKKKISPPLLQPGSFLVDTHCHLDMDSYASDCEAVIARAYEQGVKGIVTVGIDLASSRKAVKLCQVNSALRAIIGIHPHDSGNAHPSDLKNLAQLYADHQDVIVGYGEIGLDYVKMYSDPKTQRALFRKQLRLAKELDLPVIIHDREAHADCLDILTDEGPFRKGGIMHCFSGDISFAEKIIACNLHISIPGIVTFKNAHSLHQVATHLPLNKMLLETDGPFLAPVPFRGKRNEPAYTLFTAAAIAKLRNISIEEIAEQTTKNACQLFNTTFSQNVLG